MIWPFRKRSVFVTFDMERMACARDALITHDIPYRLKAQSNERPMGRNMGTTGRVMPCEYTIFVDKQDEESATHFIYEALRNR